MSESKDILEYAAEDSIMFQDGYREGIKRTLGKLKLQTEMYKELAMDSEEIGAYNNILDYIQELERSSNGRFLF